MANTSCRSYVSPILRTERIGDSLVKMNDNFQNLKTVLCELQNQVDTQVAIRTFFYYGPNSETNPESLMFSTIASYPAPYLIEDFINEQLNVREISKLNDQVYVIYQKTGYLSQSLIRYTRDQKVVLGPPRGLTGASQRQTVTWTTQAPDNYTIASPVFVIWKLVYSGERYITQVGFPKFSQAETSSTDLWNQPQLWSQY